MARQLDNLRHERIRLSFALASPGDRERIYQLRYHVYATELAQHERNPNKKIRDVLDDFNVYITAKIEENIVGFISITPPDRDRFSVDKYLSRDELPLKFQGDLYETRLLTVHPEFRQRKIASILMYAAIRWVDEQRGKRVIAMGRAEVLKMYERVGLRSLGCQIQAGAVTYELMTGDIDKIHDGVAKILPKLKQENIELDWQLPIPREKSGGCFHGGTSFTAIGESFQTLERSEQIINADVLDAWFPPSPKVITALQEYLPWILKTSPPVKPTGLIEAIAKARNIPENCIYPSAGSTNLIFKAFPKWFSKTSRVLLLDPTYGEYAHYCEHHLKCHIDWFELSPQRNFEIALSDLKNKFRQKYDLIILVNPNNPTGGYIPRAEFEPLLQDLPQSTTVWVDEAYIDYLGDTQSMERIAARHPNVVVCKSMSKGYALSGVRVGYLCAVPDRISDLTSDSPPWEVSLPAQIAGVKALEDSSYYRDRYRETAALRNEMVEQLQDIPARFEVYPGAANFILCLFPSEHFHSAYILEECRKQGLFLRDTSSMGSLRGYHGIRVAVKDRDTNLRILAILKQVLTQS